MVVLGGGGGGGGGLIHRGGVRLTTRPRRIIIKSLKKVSTATLFGAGHITVRVGGRHCLLSCHLGWLLLGTGP